MTSVETLYQLDGVDISAVNSGKRLTPLLHGIRLEVAQGEHIAIVGPSGAGKTTLLHTLALAQEPSPPGRMHAFGCLPWQISSARRHTLRARLFLAPQVPPLPPRQRVITAVLAGHLTRWSLGHAIASLCYPEGAEEAAAALALFGLRERLFERVERLSGGERQRVSLARMLVARTDVMLVDEPLSALDPTLAAQTLAVLQEDASRRGATLICGLHQVDLALQCFPRLVGLRAGRIEFDLPRAAVSADRLAQLYAQEVSSGESSRDAARSAQMRACLAVADVRCH